MSQNDSIIAKRILSTLETIEYIGSPPNLTVRLLSKVKDEKSSINDIAELILCSPPISASLLKLCNSAYYCRGASIDSVSRAIVHLGLKTVVQFAYAMDMIGSFQGGKHVSGFNESAFWKSGLAGALLSQEIALSQGILDAESVFLAGLLRDMGVLFLRQYFPDLFADVWSMVARDHCSFNEACTALCGLTHRSIAFLVALRWKLPPPIISIFQPPARGIQNYETIVLMRNIVLFSDYILKVKKAHTWDDTLGLDSDYAALWYLPSETIDTMLSEIVSDVNEFFRIISL